MGLRQTFGCRIDGLLEIGQFLHARCGLLPQPYVEPPPGFDGVITGQRRLLGRDLVPDGEKRVAQTRAALAEISNRDTCLLDGKSGVHHRPLGGFPGLDQLPDSGDRPIERIEVELSLQTLLHFLELTIDLLCLSLGFLEAVPGAIGPPFQLSQLGG